MGQKVNPKGFRVGVINDWDSRWFSNKKDYAKNLHEDIKIRELIEKDLKDAVVSKVEIEKGAKNIKINVYVANQGIAIGQNGENVELIKKKVTKIVDDKEKEIRVNIIGIENRNTDAQVIAQWIAAQLQARASFRVAQKKAIQRVMKSGAKGVRTLVSGRLGGADRARGEGYSEGVVPLHTIRADIDYAYVPVKMSYGILGVKVWIFKGEVLPEEKDNVKGE